jgi:5-methylcytosine-specific restriction endonuclease McrA
MPLLPGTQERNMVKKRGHVPLRTQLAAMICAWLDLPHEQAKAMTEEEIRGLIDLDHWPHRKADGGQDAHWNLRPMLRPEHAAKTKRDHKDMAKERKVRRAVDQHAARLLLKTTPGLASKPKRRWPKRKLRSRWKGLGL